MNTLSRCFLNQIISVAFGLFCSVVLAVDITDAVLSDQSSNCEDYVNTYSADVSDLQNNNDYSMAVTISSNGAKCTLSSNGIPNHNFNETGNFASAIAANQRAFSIPVNPSPANTVTPLAQSQWDAVLLNGVVLDLLSAGCYNPTAQNADNNGNTAIGCSVADGWLLDPLGAEYTFGADEHNAHTQPDGTYHYHGDPVALWRSDILIPTTIASPVIGFAADGYPIYGPYFLDADTSTVRRALSSFVQKTGSRPGPDNNDPGGSYDGTYIDDYQYIENGGDLDQCNGMVVNGQYGYYVTESYPWVLNCFIGTVDSSFSKNGGGGGGGFPRNDRDGDGLRNLLDNCPDDANSGQSDLDGNGEGDACDADIDGDGYLNDVDAFPIASDEWLDSDGDGQGDNSDNCPLVANAEQVDSDNDSIGDECTTDIPVMSPMAIFALASLLIGFGVRRVYLS